MVDGKDIYTDKDGQIYYVPPNQKRRKVTWSLYGAKGHGNDSKRLT